MAPWGPVLWDKGDTQGTHNSMGTSTPQEWLLGDKGDTHKVLVGVLWGHHHPRNRTAPWGQKGHRQLQSGLQGDIPTPGTAPWGPVLWHKGDTQSSSWAFGGTSPSQEQPLGDLLPWDKGDTHGDSSDPAVGSFGAGTDLVSPPVWGSLNLPGPSH